MTSPKHEPEQGISLCPANAIYTSCYCEENVYLLAQSLLARLEVTAVWEIYVVFISNETRTVNIFLCTCPLNSRRSSYPQVVDTYTIRADLSTIGSSLAAESSRGTRWARSLGLSCHSRPTAQTHGLSISRWIKRCSI